MNLEIYFLELLAQSKHPNDRLKSFTSLASYMNLMLLLLVCSNTENYPLKVRPNGVYDLN
jgi:hypothetical protein